MSTFKKLLALTLALAMVLSVSVFAGYKADTYKDAAAIDADCKSAIELMYALEIMKGDNNGNFNPEATITRAEVAKMIYVILNYGKDDLAVNYKGAKIFSDVNAGDWFEGYVNYAATTKLVNGRGNGTFGPNDPVTCAEAAKMLLTAIGYSSEARGYTGANWAQNVLSDAAVLKLLDGYKFNTNTYAPRQWVAVMFANALECYTFNTMIPSINGLLISGTNDFKGYDKMGKKYYGLESTEAYLYATEDAYIDRVEYKDKTKSTYAPDDCLLFSDGTVIESSELGYMDLGQKFRVIYDATDIDTVYSIRPITSDVADSILKDITVETTYATSSNDAKNKYVFTVDSMEAKFETYTIPALTVDYAKDGKPGTITAAELNTAAGTKSADLYRAVDKNADGEIDYMIIVPYTYAYVNKVGEHKNYGTYFTAWTDIDDEVTYKPAGYTGDKWYLDDVVNTDDEIVKGNFIKVNYNLDNGKYDVEVLPVAEGVTYDKRTSKGVHTLGGEEYVSADKAFEEAAEELVSANLKEEMDIVTDGELVIYAVPSDSDYADLADINAQLVMVTDAYVDIYENSNYNRYYIDYMTIDGEMHEEVRYVDGKDNGTTDKAANVNYAELVAAKEDGGYIANDQRLFVLVESGNGVYLKKLEENPDNSKDILDYSSTLLTGYNEEEGKLDTENNELFNRDYIESENQFFVSYYDTDDAEWVFDVMTIDELGEGVDANAFVQGLYKEKRSYDLYLAGHICLRALNLNEADGYLYTTSGDIYEDDYYGYDMLTNVFTDDGELVDAEIAVDLADGQEIYANCLYSYTYEKENGEKVYTLKLVDEKTDDKTIGNRIDVVYDETYFNAGDSKYELTHAYVADNGDEKVVSDHASGREKVTMASSYTIALKKVVLDRNQNQNGINDELYFDIETEIEFIDFATLIDEEAESELPYCIYDGESDDTYNYYSDYYWVGTRVDADDVTAKMLYVITYAVEKEAQDNDLEELKEDAIAALEEYAEAAAAANGKTVADAAIKAELAKQIEAVEDAADAEAVEAIVKNEHPNYGTGILAIWAAASAVAE